MPCFFDLTVQLLCLEPIFTGSLAGTGGDSFFWFSNGLLNQPDQAFNRIRFIPLLRAESFCFYQQYTLCIGKFTCQADQALFLFREKGWAIDYVKTQLDGSGNLVDILTTWPRRANKSKLNVFFVNEKVRTNFYHDETLPFICRTLFYGKKKPIIYNFDLFKKDNMTGFLEKLKQKATSIKQETTALYFAYRDPRTPWHARAFSALVVAYFLSPIDLVPDFIPILGYLDDLILVPLGITLALKMIPPEVLADAQKQAVNPTINKSTSIGITIVILLCWIFITALIISILIRLFNKA